MPLMPLWLRVALSFSALLGILFAVCLGGVYRDTSRGVWTDLDRQMLGLAQTELSSALDGPNQGPHLHAKGAPHRGVIFQPDGLILAATPGLSPSECRQLVDWARPLAPQKAPLFLERNPYRLIVMPASLAPLPDARLVLATPVEPVRRVLAQVARGLWFWGGLGTVSGSLLAAVLARLLTRPLENVAAVARSVCAGQLDQRMQLSRESSEIHTLKSSLNQMLDSLQSSLHNQQRRAQQQKQFMADASHELRNPLHGLRGTLEVALRRPREPEEYQEVLGIALKETDRLRALVQDMLLLSRSDLDRLDLERTPVSLESLLEESQRACQAHASQHQVVVKLSLQPCLLAVDARRLRQVVDNLLDNAIRYSPAGESVELSLRVSEQQVEIAVEDRGPGMAPPEYETVFERFTRLDPSRQRDSGGLGLGLAIARALVLAHGGEMGAGARSGGGSRFWFRLPRQL